MKSMKSRSRSRRALLLLTLGLATSAASIGSAVLLEGCSSDATGGGRVILKTRIALEPSAKYTFTTGAGWNVTLTRVLLSTGPFYYFDGAPPLVAVPSQRDWHYAQRLLGLSIAHAHPGHYQAGNALGQTLQPWSVDLLAGPTELAVGDGVTGTYRSARFSFSAPPVGPLARELGGHVALAEGTAAKDGEPVHTFLATADLPDIERSAADGHIDGCEFVEAAITGDGTVTVTVDPAVWFNVVDFAQADVGSAEAPAELSADSQPQIAFAQGVAQLNAYKFSYSKD
jgi:hypothetical protein